MVLGTGQGTARKGEKRFGVRNYGVSDQLQPDCIR